jgi:hypothetical protein
VQDVLDKHQVAYLGAVDFYVVIVLVLTAQYHLVAVFVPADVFHHSVVVEQDDIICPQKICCMLLSSRTASSRRFLITGLMLSPLTRTMRQLVFTTSGMLMDPTIWSVGEHARTRHVACRDVDVVDWCAFQPLHCRLCRADVDRGYGRLLGKGEVTPVDEPLLGDARLTTMRLMSASLSADDH